MKLILAIKLLIVSIFADHQLRKLPTAIIHGMGDYCDRPSMTPYTDLIGQKIGSKAKCFGHGASNLIGIKLAAKIVCD